ncbi:MAG: LacI family transcriptional regulator, partial [Candidatus Omnitrophica bacterium]|nr:LacI family transcriptional regulator [Candidatus Omnitrophota bacterium]
MAVSMRDVAEKAGVSISTVSRVLSGSTPVRPEIATRVLAAARDLNYRPNLLARGLKSQKSRTLALLLPDLSNPVFNTIADAVQEQAYQRGFDLLIMTSRHSAQREAEMLDRLLGRRVAGIIFQRVENEQTASRTFHSDRVPVVVIDRQVADPELPFVGVANHDAGYQATRHLIEQGHRAILHISGPLSLQLSHERIAGYRSALASVGSDASANLIIESDFKAEGGQRAIRQALRAGLGFTAVFAANDMMAIGALTELVKEGRRVPQDVSVIGMDDIWAAAWTTPALTTVRQPLVRMAQESVDLLVALIEGRQLRS